MLQQDKLGIFSNPLGKNHLHLDLEPVTQPDQKMS